MAELTGFYLGSQANWNLFVEISELKCITCILFTFTLLYEVNLMYYMELTGSYCRVLTTLYRMELMYCALCSYVKWSVSYGVNVWYVTELSQLVCILWI